MDDSHSVASEQPKQKAKGVRVRDTTKDPVAKRSRRGETQKPNLHGTPYIPTTDHLHPLQNLPNDHLSLVFNLLQTHQLLSARTVCLRWYHVVSTTLKTWSSSRDLIAHAPVDCIREPVTCPRLTSPLTGLITSISVTCDEGNEDIAQGYFDQFASFRNIRRVIAADIDTAIGFVHKTQLNTVTCIEIIYRRVEGYIHLYPPYTIILPNISKLIVSTYLLEMVAFSFPNLLELGNLSQHNVDTNWRFDHTNTLPNLVSLLTNFRMSSEECSVMALRPSLENLRCLPQPYYSETQRVLVSDNLKSLQISYSYAKLNMKSLTRLKIDLCEVFDLSGCPSLLDLSFNAPATNTQAIIDSLNKSAIENLDIFCSSAVCDNTLKLANMSRLQSLSITCPSYIRIKSHGNPIVIADMVLLKSLNIVINGPSFVSTIDISNLPSLESVTANGPIERILEISSVLTTLVHLQSVNLSTLFTSHRSTPRLPHEAFQRSMPGQGPSQLNLTHTKIKSAGIDTTFVTSLNLVNTYYAIEKMIATISSTMPCLSRLFLQSDSDRVDRNAQLVIDIPSLTSLSIDIYGSGKHVKFVRPHTKLTTLSYSCRTMSSKRVSIKRMLEKMPNLESLHISTLAVVRSIVIEHEHLRSISLIHIDLLADSTVTLVAPRLRLFFFPDFQCHYATSFAKVVTGPFATCVLAKSFVSPFVESLEKSGGDYKHVTVETYVDNYAALSKLLSLPEWVWNYTPRI